MSFQFNCACGRPLIAPESAVGRRGRCPGCGTIFTVPAPPVPVEPIPVLTIPSAAPAKAARPYHYLLLLLVLLPLAWSTVRPTEERSVVERVHQTVAAHPEVQPAFDDLPERVGKAEVLAILPNDRCDGALLAYDTYGHWAMAAASAAAFFALVVLLFPPGHTRLWQLAAVAAFTGTAGIVLLLAFQWLAFHMPLFRGGSVVTLVLDLIWLIGQSYAMALGDHGFLVSALGFTAGVGFCEEACKAIPPLFKARTTGFLNWRSALLWGLISGVGFGVSEGVTYSHDYYNGVLGGQVYAVRFVSCVGLHAIWAAAVGIAVFRRQDQVRRVRKPGDWLVQVLAVVIVPMVLHGLYDTLLKQQYDGAALGVALASFGWLTFQIEMAKRRLDGVVMTV